MTAAPKPMKEGIPYFGVWMKQRRKALGITRAELANRVPCSPDTIQKIETGLRRPSREMALRLIECLHVPQREHPALVEIARASALSAGNIAWLDHIRPPSNLPIPPTPLIGRDDEVSALRQTILRNPGSLLTIMGSPGVGKTRLAVQAAASLRDEYEDGVFMVPLAPIADPELVVSSIARTLNLEDCGTRMAIDQLIDHLRDKEILLLIDNFEHLLKATPYLLRVRAECPLISILVTSRTALRVRGERQIHVQPLRLPDPNHLPGVAEMLDYPAIALFVDRAQAVQPAFTLNDQNAADVAAICQRLDGLPLAIELIAANLCILTTHMLVESLKNGGLLETGDFLDLERRQRTLRDTLDWSCCLLTPVEQKLLERLAVFSGGWTLEATQKVCATGQESQPAREEISLTQIPKQLRSLVEKSLVAQHEENGSTRFSMLEVVREYLTENFVHQEEADEIQRRHAEYYTNVAEGAEAHLRGPKSAQTLKYLEQESSNFRSSLTWCLSTPQALETGLRLAAALWWFWLRGGHVTEGKTWLMRTIDRCEPGNRITSEMMIPLAKIYTGMSKLSWYQGDYVAARCYAEKSVSLHRQVGDQWYLGYALQILSDILSDMDDCRKAQETALESLALARESGDPWLEGLPHALLGELARNRGDYLQAQEQYSASLSLIRKAGDEGNIAFILHNLGQMAQRQGDYARAQELHIEALTIHARSRPPRAVAYGLEMLAGVAGACGKPIKAARLLGAAEALRQGAGCPVEGTELDFYRGVISKAHDGLDQQAFTTAWVEGSAMTIEQAIAYALEG